MKNNRFSIDGVMICDADSDPIPSVYIRELLDSECNEYENSKLNNQQKLHIINELGLETLTHVLAECYRSKSANYNAEEQARFVWNKLNGKNNFWEAAYEA